VALQGLSPSELQLEEAVQLLAAKAAKKSGKPKKARSGGIASAAAAATPVELVTDASGGSGISTGKGRKKGPAEPVTAADSVTELAKVTRRTWKTKEGLQNDGSSAHGSSGLPEAPENGAEVYNGTSNAAAEAAPLTLKGVKRTRRKASSSEEQPSGKQINGGAEVLGKVQDQAAATGTADAAGGDEQLPPKRKRGRPRKVPVEGLVRENVTNAC
jgi:hypothetical protein